jgi:molybdopterin synthase sulfur carrier subunit
MAVQVNVTATLRNLVGAKSVEVEGGTIGEVLQNLEARFPGFRKQISDGTGSLHRFVNIYLNDEDIRYLNALDTKLKEGDVVSILPALAGGSGARASGPQPEGWGIQNAIHAPTFRLG